MALGEGPRGSRFEAGGIFGFTALRYPGLGLRASKLRVGLRVPDLCVVVVVVVVVIVVVVVAEVVVVLQQQWSWQQPAKRVLAP